MAELLFEILSEEIPARMQVRAGQDLSKAMTAGLEKAGLSVENGRVFTGPRRLTYVADVPLRSPDISEERKGPRVGSPESALEGFMKASGLSDISEAEVRTDPKKGEFYVAIIESAGRDTKAILSELIPDVMRDFPWPKSMKSGGSSFRWVRPLRGLTLLLDGDVVALEVGGISSSNITMGHRRHGPGPYTVSDFASYQSQLENAGHVILSHDARKEIIKTKASEICKANGFELVEDEGLLNEVAGLTEWPVVLFGDMDPEFLTLPDEVIRLTLKSHQKTFTVRDPKTGNLAAHFIIVANQVAPDGGEAIKAGNGKVISARLSDAVFFQSEDRKVKLIDYYDKLNTVVFHKKLGSIRDKAERVAALSRELAPKTGADPDMVEQAAKLAKCDLVTQTVIEFTSLQGQVGSLMYEAEGGDGEIATAIEEHYKPQGPTDKVPTDPVAVTVALADKLDTLVSFWAIDEKPTGSKDPFALRRAALGVMQIILVNKLRLNLLEFIDRQYFYLLKQLANIDMLAWPVLYPEYDNDADYVGERQILVSSLKGEEIGAYNELGALVEYVSKDGGLVVSPGFEKHIDVSEDPTNYTLGSISPLHIVNEALLKFTFERIKVYIGDTGIRHDLIDAVFALVEDDLVAIVNRVTALQDFIGTVDGENLLAGYKRAANILKAEAKKGDLPTGDPKRPEDANGAALFDAMTAASPKITAALQSEDYAKAMKSLANLRAPIDEFFTHTQIITDDTAVRDNNLRLLAMMGKTTRQIADFERIQS